MISRRMLAADAVDVLQADATRCGGVTGFPASRRACARRITSISPAIARRRSICHVACAVPRLRHLEWFHDHVRIEHMLFDGAPTPRDGAIAPDLARPGHRARFQDDAMPSASVSRDEAIGVDDANLASAESLACRPRHVARSRSRILRARASGRSRGRARLAALRRRIGAAPRYRRRRARRDTRDSRRVSTRRGMLALLGARRQRGRALSRLFPEPRDVCAARASRRWRLAASAVRRRGSRAAARTSRATSFTRRPRPPASPASAFTSTTSPNGRAACRGKICFMRRRSARRRRCSLAGLLGRGAERVRERRPIATPRPGLAGRADAGGVTAAGLLGTVGEAGCCISAAPTTIPSCSCRSRCRRSRRR